MKHIAKPSDAHPASQGQASKRPAVIRVPGVRQTRRNKKRRKKAQRAACDPPSLDALIVRVYLPHARQRKRSWQVDERIARRHISPVFGHRRLSGIRRAEVEDWLRGLLVHGLAPATCNRILAVFKSICATAIRYGLLPENGNPCHNVTNLRVQNQRERYLTAAEARQVLRAAEASPCPEALAIRLLLLTGARKNEILRARWEHLHLDYHVLTVPLSKSGKARHIILSEEAEAVILSIPRKPDCPWLFPARTVDRPLADIYRFWHSLRCELGLSDVRIHDLRHSFASLLVNGGHSLYEVQTLLGHHDPRTTMRYAHLGQESLLAAARAVSSCLTEHSRTTSPRNP